MMFAIPSANAPGRNDPCPCGSGRKYKKCHGDSVTLATAKNRRTHPSEIIAGKRDLLMASILSFATRHGGEAWVSYTMATYVDEWYDDLPPDEAQNALSWTHFHFPAPDVAPTGDEQEMLHQFRKQFTVDWLDMSIPALGDRAPREAAADKNHHKTLDLLLREMENRENRLPIAERSDMHSLRRTLGM